MNSYADRCRAAQALMPTYGIDAIIAGATADLRYLSGYPAHTSERLTCFVVPRQGDPFMVLPAFEAPRLGAQPWFRFFAWTETDDAAQIALRELGGGRLNHVAVADRTWATFLLRLQAASPSTAWTSATPLLRELRMRKDAAEIAALRTAGAAVDSVFAEMLGWRWEGRTEHQVAEDIATSMRGRGCEAVDFAIVGSGPNGASPHHSGSSRVIGAGDSVVVDFGGPFAGGYFADITRTVVVGQPAAEFVKVYEAVKRAQETGVQAVRPGVSCEAVDAATRAVIAAAGFGPLFNHRTGHGIGLDGHEEPYIVEGNTLALTPGMAFSVEPGVYIPGKFGVRIEDIVVCTRDGVERLNNASRDLHVVR